MRAVALRLCVWALAGAGIAGALGNNSVDNNNTATAATWMAQARAINGAIDRIPLNRLLLPGAHDAFSFDLSERVAPEVPAWLVELIDDAERIMPWSELYKLIRKWAKTQGSSPIELLNSGVRFFDVRTCFDERDRVFRYHHFLMSNNELIRDDLRSVRRFLDTNPEEFVVLYFSHFAGFNLTTHHLFMKQLLDLFGDIAFAQHTPNGLKTTYGDALKAHGGRAPVLLVYPEPHITHPLLWNATTVLFDVWANTPETGILKERETAFINEASLNVTEHQLIYPQWVLTEDLKMIIESAVLWDWSNHELSRTCNGMVAERFFNSPLVSRSRVNVVYTDWVQETDSVSRAQTEALFPCFDESPSAECAKAIQLDLCGSPHFQAACARSCLACSITALPGAPGSNCSRSEDCVSDTCSRDGICLTYFPRSKGSECGIDWQCLSGKCSGWACS